MRNELGSYAPSMIHWTAQAKECYDINCNCAVCSVFPLITQECNMKAVVLELIKQVGQPTAENCRNWSFYGYGRKRNLSNCARKDDIAES